jgi:hypothetical protein
MIDADAGTQITYNDLYPALPNGNNVVSLTFDGNEVDFNDAETYYNVSTVNYLAAGSCNFNDGGVSLWPLNQIVHDTQYYVRDAVINYATAMGTIGPEVEGRLSFITDTTPPVITINAPQAKMYLNSDPLTIDFTVTDDISGVRTVTATLDGVPVANGEVIKLYMLAAGSTHEFVVTAMDKAYNTTSATVTFTVETTIPSMMTVVTNLYDDGLISKADVYQGLMDKLQAADKAKKKETKINILNAFISQVEAQSGKGITPEAAELLITDVRWLIDNLK